VTEYIHGNAKLLLEHNKSKLYIDELLVFSGSGYPGITQFVKYCNSPKVTKKFKAQLEMREKPRFKD
jgi:hypothetical protein